MNEAKARNEISVFLRFVVRAAISTDVLSVKSLNPPYPDVSCVIGGVRRFFELTRMVHRGSANVIGNHLAELDKVGVSSPMPCDSYDDRSALRAAIQRKAHKVHETDGGPLALVVFIDGLFHPAGMPAEWARAILEEEGPAGRWTEIWVYDDHRGVIVSHWTATSTDLE